MGKFYDGLLEALALYARHIAWLHAVPEVPGKKIAGADKPVSRLEKMRADMKDETYHPDMPPCDAEYLLAYLWDCGPAVSAGMGDVPLRSEHLIAWQEETGIPLQPWEAKMLRSLSREYLAQAQKSEKPDCPPPYGFAERRALVAAKIDAVFG
ncbi:MAG: hypothetical protein NUV75_01965 [Gallionella sp.]|nr:hypothetical protein [Gallionella sp.]